MNTEKLYEILKNADWQYFTDTRKVVSGGIFFALKGDNFNGNEYAQKALDQGASFAIIDEVKFKISDKFILVDNVLKSIQNVANFHRKQFTIPFIGITGSNGKTTTKELMGEVLKKKYNTLITEGNLNNHLGVPFTLLRLRPEHEIAIIEMGANKPGDIGELCEIAEPTHGLITNIGKAHIEGFGSFKGVLKTKTELYGSLEINNGVTFINSDDSILMTNAPGTDLITYGSKGQLKSQVEALTPYLSFSWSNGDYHSPTIDSKLVGDYNLYNFTAAITVGCYFDVSENEINEALAGYVPENNRSQITEVQSNTVIVDCYNANATSMKCAIENFHNTPSENKVAILGDMKELGEISTEEHQKIVEQIKQTKSTVYLVGEEFQKTKTTFETFENVEALITQLKTKGAIENSLILLKGSRSIRLEELMNQNSFEN